MHKTAGFTFIELMIVVSVIAILSGISVPLLLSFRDKSRVAQVIGTSASIRSALAAYATSATGNSYPDNASITDLASLRTLMNAQGGLLSATVIFSVQEYDFYDSDGDSVADTYAMRLLVKDVPTSISGSQILLTPQGIFKCNLGGTPCALE